MAKYSKAIMAFIALAIAIANASGFEIPEETGKTIASTVILILGTAGVFQIANKGESS